MTADEKLLERIRFISGRIFEIEALLKERPDDDALQFSLAMERKWLNEYVILAGELELEGLVKC